MIDTRQTQLDQNGYLVLDDCLPHQRLIAVTERVEELFRLEGDSAGSEFKQESGCRRLANLVNKGAIFQQLIADPVVLECVACVLLAHMRAWN